MKIVNGWLKAFSRQQLLSREYGSHHITVTRGAQPQTAHQGTGACSKACDFRWPTYAPVLVPVDRMEDVQRLDYLGSAGVISGVLSRTHSIRQLSNQFKRPINRGLRCPPAATTFTSTLGRGVMVAGQAVPLSTSCAVHEDGAATSASGSAYPTSEMKIKLQENHPILQNEWVGMSTTGVPIHTSSALPPAANQMCSSIECESNSSSAKSGEAEQWTAEDGDGPCTTSQDHAGAKRVYEESAIPQCVTLSDSCADSS
jgi:hypothetical protein